MSNISDSTVQLCKEFEDKNLLEMMLHIIYVYKLTTVETKKITLNEINESLSTNYNINHFNNWIAGRKPTPSRVKTMARQCVLQYLWGDDIAEMLAGLH